MRERQGFAPSIDLVQSAGDAIPYPHAERYLPRCPIWKLVSTKVQEPRAPQRRMPASIGCPQKRREFCRAEHIDQRQRVRLDPPELALRAATEMPALASRQVRSLYITKVAHGGRSKPNEVELLRFKDRVPQTAGAAHSCGQRHRIRPRYYRAHPFCTPFARAGAPNRSTLSALVSACGYRPKST